MRKGASTTSYSTIFDWFLSRHGDEIKTDLMTASDGERACSTFPDDRILDFLDLLNSNVVGLLLTVYGANFVTMISREVGAEKFKLTASKLKRRLEQAKKKKA